MVLGFAGGLGYYCGWVLYDLAVCWGGCVGLIAACCFGISFVWVGLVGEC